MKIEWTNELIERFWSNVDKTGDCWLWTECTWNPISGCNKVSKGCDNCYAITMAHRLSAMGQEKYKGTTKKMKNGQTNWTGKVFLDHKTLEIPLKWKKPAMVFVNSMSDLFHEKVPFEFIDKVFAVMSICPQHTFQILTKRPERMYEYFQESSRIEAIEKEGELLINDFWYQNNGDIEVPSPWYFDKHVDEFGLKDSEWIYEDELPFPNVWLGVSVEDQKTADERIPILLQVPAAVRWISAEPLLGDIDIQEYLHDSNCNEVRSYTSCICSEPREVCIDWVVIGGESGHNARYMNGAWAYRIIDDCTKANVPVFFKQTGSLLAEFPKQYQIREFPKV